MEPTTLSKTLNNLPELVKNTHLNITLNGWPATVAIISGCISMVAIYAIKASHQEAVSDQEEAA